MPPLFIPDIRFPDLLHSSLPVFSLQCSQPSCSTAIYDSFLQMLRLHAHLHLLSGWEFLCYKCCNKRTENCCHQHRCRNLCSCCICYSSQSRIYLRDCHWSGYCVSSGTGNRRTRNPGSSCYPVQRYCHQCSHECSDQPKKDIPEYPPSAICPKCIPQPKDKERRIVTTGDA